MKWTLISGTNRADSMSLHFSKFVEEKLRINLSENDRVQFVDLKEMPSGIFTPQSYAQKPAEFQPYQDLILESDAVIPILPEYNGSAPGVFKLFIDMLSFPESLYHMPCWFLGISAGRFASLRSVEQMQQVFQYRNAFIFPENILISQIEKNFDKTTGIQDEFILNLFNQSLNNFIQFVRKLRA